MFKQYLQFVWSYRIFCIFLRCLISRQILTCKAGSCRIRFKTTFDFQLIRYHYGQFKQQSFNFSIVDNLQTLINDLQWNKLSHLKCGVFVHTLKRRYCVTQHLVCSESAIFCSSWWKPIIFFDICKTGCTYKKSLFS